MRTGRRIAWLGIIAIALGFSVQISGCSLIGLIAGSAVDSGKPKLRVIPPGQAIQVSPGARVTLHFEDGTSASGRYLGVGAIPRDEYVLRYQSWRDSLPDGTSFPALGDSIRLSLRTGERRAATFEGFAYRQVVIGAAADGAADGVPFENLVSLTGPANHSIPVERLIGHDVSGDLPSTTALKVSNGRDISLTAVDRIARVELGVARHGARNGFLIGLAVDALVVMVAASSYESSGSSSSCDGSGFAPTYGVIEAPFDTWTGRLVPDTEGAPERPATEEREAPGASRAVTRATLTEPRD